MIFRFGNQLSSSGEVYADIPQAGVLRQGELESRKFAACQAVWPVTEVLLQQQTGAYRKFRHLSQRVIHRLRQKFFFCSKLLSKVLIVPNAGAKATTIK